MADPEGEAPIRPSLAAAGLLVALLGCARASADEPLRIFIPANPRNATLVAAASPTVAVEAPGPAPTPTRPAASPTGGASAGAPSAVPTATPSRWTTATATPSPTRTPIRTATPPGMATPTRTSSPTRTPTHTRTTASTHTATPTRTAASTHTPATSATAGPPPASATVGASASTATATPTPTPTPLFYGAADGFDRADAVALGAADSAQSWETDGSSWGICASQACLGANPTGSVGNYARIETNLTDVRVAVTIDRPATGTVSQAALLARVTPDWARYQLYIGIDPLGTIDVWELSDGNWEQRVTSATAFGASRVRRLEARVGANTLDVYVDGQLLLGGVIVQPPPPGATRAGLFADTSDASAHWPRFDDFVAARQP